ncbi:DUF3768 domain-containing protein [Bradyrhizobium sp. AS23.2]|uniref:DUF3768 domain-containing protein n=1 Tax=Bradyrhizobium sp. AS23.2 TaxID=1680155 RepID=UPI0011611D2B|nr:DUF3768 domain-containing protein [Bradyrhizobium sp. AS23.2]
MANELMHRHRNFSFKFDDVEVFFKIDYDDANLEFGSPDPAVTRQVITLMLTQEY